MMKKICFLIIIFVFTACQPKQPKYIFYFIGDGMGVNQVLATEMYLAAQKGYIGVDSLSFTNFPVRNFISTYSKYNAVTCSAAAGTALASGYKTRKGAIGMDSLLQTPLYSVAYNAKKAGKSVGIVTTVSIDHATPAAFYAHQPNRSMGFEIAKDAAASNFDFFAGSGFSQCKKENEPNIISLLSDSGYFVARGIEQYFQQKNIADKIVLLQCDSMSNLPYVIDRTPADLSLPQMTEAAIEYLDKNSDGFFLMIEGGLIDWACHNNDAAAVLAEVEEFSDAIAKALDFYKKHADETLIVVTADHETGGIALGTGDYCLDLNVLQYQKCSVNELTNKISALREGGVFDWDNLKRLLQDNLGFWKELPLSEAEEYRLVSLYEQTLKTMEMMKVHNLYFDNELIAQTAIDILNRKAKIGWTSYGHSAGVVPVYAIGCKADMFEQVKDNVDIPRLMFKMLNNGPKQ